MQTDERCRLPAALAIGACQVSINEMHFDMQNRTMYNNYVCKVVPPYKNVLRKKDTLKHPHRPPRTWTPVPKAELEWTKNSLKRMSASRRGAEHCERMCNMNKIQSVILVASFFFRIVTVGCVVGGR